MNRFARCFLVMVAAATAAVLGVGFEAAEAQGIIGTKHNLSPLGTGAVKALTQFDTGGAPNTEVCVYCHTPHGADTTVAAPLWNRAINTTGYAMYNSPTFDATRTPQPTGVSLACLSCHDGTIAFDALRNLPGSGGFNNAPAKTGVTNWTWNGGNRFMPGSSVANLGQDLTNDHPISMTYSTALSPSSTSPDNTHATGFYPATGDDIPIKNAAGAAIGGNLKLYAGEVQCASCHDPHRSNTNTFLRVNNDSSQLCLSCHKKNG